MNTLERSYHTDGVTLSHQALACVYAGMAKRRSESNLEVSFEESVQSNISAYIQDAVASGTSSADAASLAVRAAMEEQMREAMVAAAMEALEQRTEAAQANPKLGTCVAKCALGTEFKNINSNLNSSESGGLGSNGLGSTDQGESSTSIKDMVAMVMRSGRRREYPACRRRRREKTACDSSKEEGTETCGRRRISVVVGQLGQVAKLWAKKKIGLGVSSVSNASNESALVEVTQSSFRGYSGLKVYTWLGDRLQEAKDGLSSAWKSIVHLKDQIASGLKDWADKLADAAKEAATQLFDAVNSAKDTVLNQLKRWYDSAVNRLMPFLEKILKPVKEFFNAVKLFGSHLLAVPQSLVGIFNVVGDIFNHMQAMGGLYSAAITKFYGNLQSDPWKVFDITPQVKTGKEIYEVLKQILDDTVQLARYARSLFELFNDLYNVMEKLAEMVAAVIREVLEGIVDIKNLVLVKGVSFIADSEKYEHTFSVTINDALECLYDIIRPLTDECVLDKTPVECKDILNSFDTDDLFDALQRGEQTFKLIADELHAFKNWLLDGFQHYVAPVVQMISSAVSTVFSKVGTWVTGLSNDVVGLFTKVFDNFKLGSLLDITELRANISSRVLERIEPEHHHLVGGGAGVLLLSAAKPAWLA